MLLPYSYILMRLDSYRADFERLTGLCAERRVAVQTIKSLACGRWTDQNDPHFSWYEPVADVAARGRLVSWVLANQQVFLISSSDVRLLRQTLEVASSAGPAPSDEELAADARELRIEPPFDGGKLERI